MGKLPYRRIDLVNVSPSGSGKRLPGPAVAIVLVAKVIMTKKGGRKSGLTFLVREIDFFGQGVVSQS